ncbi:MAG: hypothetical protein K1Y02_25440, partial [Candidatus Hydrogenedentes bacterium]|nr:hypothetical protein [Candidatus Hydrogenedentota bacterium]
MNNRACFQPPSSLFIVAIAVGLAFSPVSIAQEDAAQEQHKVIGVQDTNAAQDSFHRTTHADAQWYPEAGLGLFIHWGIASVQGDAELSWA